MLSGRGINVELPEELTLFTVDNYRAQLVDKIGNENLESIDASNLSLLDGAGIQLLLSLYKSFPHIKLRNLSHEHMQDLELMGVSEMLIKDGSVKNE